MLMTPTQKRFNLYAQALKIDVTETAGNQSRPTWIKKHIHRVLLRNPNVHRFTLRSRPLRPLSSSGSNSDSSSSSSSESTFDSSSDSNSDTSSNADSDPPPAYPFMETTLDLKDLRGQCEPALDCNSFGDWASVLELLGNWFYNEEKFWLRSINLRDDSEHSLRFNFDHMEAVVFRTLTRLLIPHVDISGSQANQLFEAACNLEELSCRSLEASALRPILKLKTIRMRGRYQGLSTTLQSYTDIFPACQHLTCSDWAFISELNYFDGDILDLRREHRLPGLLSVGINLGMARTGCEPGLFGLILHKCLSRSTVVTFHENSFTNDRWIKHVKYARARHDLKTFTAAPGFCKETSTDVEPKASRTRSRMDGFET
jgi:hypothetical protein